MPEQTGKYEILVAVDGSPESDAAVRWATHEAELRELPITLAHVVVPVVTTWPVRSLQTEFNEWQEDNARQVLEQAQKMLRSTLGDSELPNVRTEVLHDYAVPALVKASKQAQMIVVGSRGMDRSAAPCWVPSAAVWSTMRTAQSRSSTRTKRSHPTTLRLFCSASTDRPPPRRPPPWPSTKHRAAKSNWWRYTRGATSESSPSWACTGASTKTRATRSLASAWRGGKSSIRMWSSGGGSCAIGLPAG